jgi:hypothetical protein
MSQLGQKRRFGRRSATSGSPTTEDILWSVSTSHLCHGDILHRRKVVEFFRYRDAMLF